MVMEAKTSISRSLHTIFAMIGDNGDPMQTKYLLINY